jgi:hypothetical protein
MAAAIVTGILLMVALQVEAPPVPEPPGMGAVAEEVRHDTGSELDGKVLVVRMYSDWENSPGQFELLAVPFKGNQVTIEPDEATIPQVAVITAEDQKDEAIRKAVGDYVCVQSVRRELVLRLPFTHGPDREACLWLFVDALGEPLGNAAVEIWIAGLRGHPRIRFGRATLDPGGALGWKRLAGDLPTIHFTISHPEYGCAEVQEPHESARKLTVPLVRRGTAAAERAIYGRVVDPNGVPVAGATIECRVVFTPGQGAINGLGEPCRGIADAHGLFSFYMPNQKLQEGGGRLIPPKSQYQVRIDAPKKLGLLPYVEPIGNGQESLIVLEHGDRLRRLRFENRDGEMTDSSELEKIAVCLQRSGHAVWFDYEEWKDGILLPTGTYHATTRGLHGEYNFAPVEVTRQTPETLVFRLPAGVTYYGRVVHGITGRPMPGAFVLAMNGRTERRLCDLTAAQWATLHSLASDPNADDAALDPLRNLFTFTKLVRTDRTGTYGISLEPNEAFHSFAVFEQDYLAVMYRRHSLQADAARFAEVPTIKLFPAATVFVETTVDRQFLSIMPTWEIDEDSRPAWIGDLLGLHDGRESSLEYKDWLPPNARRAVHVPAGVSLRLKLDFPHGDEEFCPLVIPEVIYLNQGEAADLGRFELEAAIPVQVRVVDSAGQVIEGIPVRTVEVRPDGTHWNTPRDTDEQGIARFHVIPNSTGKFGVFYHGSDGFHLQEMVDYKVAGPEEAGREFVLQISDEMLTHLLY